MRLAQIASLICLLLLNTLRAEPGVAVLDSMAGQVEVTGLETVERAAVFNPAGVSIRTAHNSFAVIVFSNGVSLYLAENTALQIDHFNQEPFEARPDDFEFEPSRSQLQVTLSEGDMGVAQRDPNPSSKFVIALGDGASVDLKTRLSAVMHQGEGLGAITAIFDGHGSMDIGDVSLLCNENYRLSSGAIDPAERVRLMSEDQIEDWRPLAQKAQVALRRWYFQTPEVGVIQPLRVEPSSYRSTLPYNNTKL